MASLAKHVANEKRKLIIKKRGPELKQKKSVLADYCKIKQREQIIQNIEAKLLSPSLTNDQKEVLRKEMAIYKQKNENAVKLSDTERWKNQFEINIMGKEIGTQKVRSRCSIPNCSRPRGVLKLWGLCRIHVRNYAAEGILPGNMYQRSW